MLNKFLIWLFFATLQLLSSIALAEILEWEVGLTTERSVIRAQGTSAYTKTAPTILYIAGLDGQENFARQFHDLLQAYSRIEEQERSINLITIPLANPDEEALVFPPTGDAYAENPTAHALWRWIGSHAPDLVIVAGGDRVEFSRALQSESVAGMGTISVRTFSSQMASTSYLQELQDITPSQASLEVSQRLARSPAELANQLAEIYGYDFSTPAYVPGMSLIGRMRLGHMADVESLLEDYLQISQINVANPSVMAGHLVFAEFAERTGNRAALRHLVNAADLAFDEQGSMREAMPMHSEMSDSFFMATPLLVKAGKLSQESRYFDMAARHVTYMRNMLLRDNGLYRHSPEADVAWSRGNGFPALGLALSLTDIPMTHPARDILMGYFAKHLESLRPHQDIDGMWHEVIDYPGSFAEITSTAMIGFAIKRGLDRGWLPQELYQPLLDRAWDAVLIRTSKDGEFINACASTGKMPSLEAYLERPAIMGKDDRAGGMVMLFASEMAGVN